MILVFSLGLSLAPGRLAYLPYDFRTVFFSVSTHPVTDESVVGISVSAAREFAAFVPYFKKRDNWVGFQRERLSLDCLLSSSIKFPI